MSSPMMANTTTSAPLWGLSAEFAGPEALLKAAAAARDAGYKRFDVHTPFPVHGMDDAMGLERSHLGWIVAAGALAGVLTAAGLQWFTQAIDYPLITGGMPYGAWQPFVPVLFELAVLFAAFAAIGGMIALNGLPRWYHPALKNDSVTRCGDNAFVMVIEASDSKFDAAGTAEWLGSIGGTNVLRLEE